MAAEFNPRPGPSLTSETLHDDDVADDIAMGDQRVTSMPLKEPLNASKKSGKGKSNEPRPTKGNEDIEPTADNLDDYCRQLVAYINGSADCELTLEEAMTLQSYLAQVPDEDHEDWLRINAPEAVARCMERASQFAQAQEWGCAALWNLAIKPENAPALVALGALDTLVACLGHPQHQNHLGVQAQSFGTLAAMTQGAEGQKAVLEHEVYKTFISLLGLYRKRLKRGKTPRHKDFERWAGVLLAHVADGRSDVQQQCVDDGLPKVLLEFLEPFGPKDTASNTDTSEVIEAALSGLERLCIDSADAKRMFMDNDGPQTVVAAVNKARDGPAYLKASMLCAALARGASQADLKAMREAKMPEMVQEGLEAYPTFGELQTYGYHAASLMTDSAVSSWVSWSWSWAMSLVGGPPPLPKEPAESNKGKKGASQR